MSEPSFRVGVLASGRGTNLQALIEASRSGALEATIAVVISDRPKAEALDRAREAGIPAVFLDPKSHETRQAYDGAAADLLREHGVELVILAGYMRLVSGALISPFKDRIINIHPSLLPSFPGLRAQKQALDWGVRITGCTVHMVDETMDQGPIIIQAAVPVMEGDTPEGLEARILEEEHRILPQAVRYFAEKRLSVSGRKVLLKSPKPWSGKSLAFPGIEVGGTLGG